MLQDRDRPLIRSALVAESPNHPKLGTLRLITPGSEIMSDQEPVRIVLTAEQRELVKRLSGQHVDAIDVAPDDMKKGGGPLRFFWRLSAATGIPRQAWGDETDQPPGSASEKPTKAPA
jgi:hypothetical protein